MITTNTGAKKLEASDNWREIFPNPDLSTAGAHNASVDAADRIQPEIAPIINGKQCALGAASGDYVLLRNSTITGKSDGAYIAAKAIPANTDIDSTYLGNAITGGISNSLNSNLTQKANYSVPTIFGYAAGITSHNLQARRVGNVIFLSGYFECISIAENTPLFFVSGIDMATFGVVEQYQGRPYSVRIASNGGLETNEALSGNTYYVNLCIPVSGN